MTTVKIRLECAVCREFKKVIEINTNEHGFFAISDAYCPHCLSLLKQIINHDKGNKE